MLTHFFPSAISFYSILLFLMYDGLGVGLLWSGFYVDGVWGQWCVAFAVFFLGWSSLYSHRRKTLGIKMVLYSLTITVIIKGNIIVEAVRCSHPSSALNAATYSPTHMMISPKKFGCRDIFHNP